MFPATYGKCSAIDALRGVGRLIWPAFIAFLITLAGPTPWSLAEAIRLEISNFPTWKELEDVRGVPRPGLRLSTLERWDAQSKPYVRITNESNSPMVGFNIDLKNWDAKISAVKQLYGPEQSSWKWQEELQAATFQLRDPLLPGKALVVRLTTAAKTGVESQYRMNQTLFSPANLNCVVCPTGGGVFNMLLATPGSGILTASMDLQNFPVMPPDTITPSGVSATIPITPVPEPEALLLAASAAALLVVKAMRRRSA